jgi:hypothetical protein
MPSAISTPTFQALASSIKNADGTTAIYSLGAWTFKNSSAVTTFAVSDAGAVTAATNTTGHTFGSTGGAAGTTILNIKTKSGSNAVLSVATNSAIFNITAVAGTDISLDDSGTLYKYAQISTAGAWTFPVSTNTPRMLANTIQTKTAGGTFIFANANDTNVGSYANDGIWLFPFNYAATGGTQAAAYMSTTGRLGLVNPSRASSKTNVAEIGSVLDKIENVRGLVSFDYIDEELPKDQLGLIADDFLKDFPSVCVFLNGKLHSIDYGKVSAIALSGVKELSCLVKEQQALIEEQAKALEALQARLEALEKPDSLCSQETK